LLVFACLFGGALFGMLLQRALPEHHIKDDSRRALEFCLGIIGTMAGLVLGLLVAAATTSYNAQRSEVQDAASRVILLDRLLAHYGPAARTPRTTLRISVQRTLNRIWPQEGAAQIDPRAVAGGEALLDQIEDLSADPNHAMLKGQIVGLAISIAGLRWLMYEQSGSSISVPLLVLLVFWFTITFIGFGVFAPSNPTVAIAFALCALAVSGAVFITLEMYSPFEGLLQISSAPLRDALVNLGH
jgi:hypothetical protein